MLLSEQMEHVSLLLLHLVLELAQFLLLLAHLGVQLFERI